MSQLPPLTGVRVLEFAGLAPGPFAGLLLADYGATVLRVDRAHSQAFTDDPPPATADQLVRRKSSVTVNTKSPAGVEFIRRLLTKIDVVIDPFRPGVLEKMGLGPEEVMLKLNPRLVIGRMTGFRRDGRYKDMAGHDINYIAVSGVLSMLGRQSEKPFAPGNIIGDFAGGGAVCFMGILLALLQRERSGQGQVVEANMVDGSSYMASMPRFNLVTPMWDGARGTNFLDGGCPYYDTYETKDGRHMAVGPLEPQFFAELLKGLEIDVKAIGGPREDKRTWPKQRDLYSKRFRQKTRDEWERIFDGKDACCTPVLTQGELREGGFDQRPIVTLTQSPGYAIAEKGSGERTPAEGQGEGVTGSGWTTSGLRPGEHGEAILEQWMGWRRGRQYELHDGGLVWAEARGDSKL